MSTIRISGRATIASAEDNYARIAELDDAMQLILPSTIKFSSPGESGAVLQTICTWARASDKPTLGTFIESAADLSKFLQSDHGLLSILLATKVLNRRGEEITAIARSEAVKFLPGRQKIPSKQSGVRVGSAASVFAVDHLNRFSTPEDLYQEIVQRRRGENVSSMVIDERARFKFAGQEFPAEGQTRLQPVSLRLLSLAQLGEAGRQANAKHVRALGNTLFELFQNTHEHARHRADGTRLPTSVRVLSGRGHALPRDVALDGADDADGSFITYLRQPRHRQTRHVNARPESAQTMRFVEVNILDCGPGLGAKVLWSQGVQDNASQAQEFVALQSCLRGIETGPSRPMRGLGLRNVQELLTACGGAMRIRTGRFSLLRDFIAHPYDAESDGSHHWIRGSRPNPLAPTSGTLVTILIPAVPQEEQE